MLGFAMRVLVIEDDDLVASGIVAGLRLSGITADHAATASSAETFLRTSAFDVAVLDLGLPDADGLDLLRRLRGGGLHLPVLVLTARDAVQDKVAGLRGGADDYLVKPFDFEELKARVRALLRRDAGRSGAVLRVGDIELDSSRHDARRDGHQLPLTPKEFALLRYFMSRPGQVLSQEDLLEHVWDENADPFTNTVRVTVMTLRRKLADAGDSQPIETVVGRGYRLREQP
jgi:DNA-binding response OmpR family regulator